MHDTGHIPLRFRFWTLAIAALIALVAAFPFSRAAQVPSLEKASWIWSNESNSICALRKTFSLDATPTHASILITADNGYELFVNGSFVGSEAGVESHIWQSVERYDITARLAKGRNVVGIRGIDLGDVRGVIAALTIAVKDKPALDIPTDATWRANRDAEAVLYSHPEYIEGLGWEPARVKGPMGVPPWGTLAWSQSTGRKLPAKSSAQVENPGPHFKWPERLVFISDDCSVYVPLRGDAWGVAFRINDWSRAYTEFDLPCPSKIGRKLFSLEPGPGAKPQLLLDAGAGVLGSPSVSFDGQTLLVAWAPEGEHFFHVFKIPLAGGPPVRLTDGPFHDIDPAELPDGRIVFASTRIGTFEEYHQPPSRALFRMNADGSDIHPITSTLIFDNEPKVMASGRIAFIRTDNFFDRGKVETHLHSIRPDGTDGLAEFAANVGPLYGSRLRAFGYGSPAPLPDGRLAYISNLGNYIGASGSPAPEQHRLPDSLGDVAPLPDGRILCSVLRPASNRMESDVLGVIDPVNNKIISIYQSTNGSLHSPVSAAARSRPPIIPDYVDRSSTRQSGTTGFLFCQNARLTTKTAANWNRIRAIRVLGAVPLTTRSSHSHIVHVGHETVELGTVPLAPDGSFSIEVPADMPLALQAVDAEGRSELNEMSWLYVRPGERRSCIGCHQARESTPPFDGHPSDALRAPPVKLLGQGDPHRFRGNNPGVTGLMDLQFERFRECASINRNAIRNRPIASRRDEIADLIQHLQSSPDALKISSAQRLALFHDRSSAPSLAQALKLQSREVRLVAALALAACGTRESIAPLVGALSDPDPVVTQAAHVALENLTGHTPPSSEPITEIEARLVSLLKSDAPGKRSAIVALGHIGTSAACNALRDFVQTESARQPYPPFVNDNRTDTFTFHANSPWDPRTLQEAVRALGHLQDFHAVPMLRDLLNGNLDPKSGNLFLAEAVIESLGRIGTAEAETALINAFAQLKDYWHYVGWYSDHPALYACHSSPIHARMIEALDTIGSTNAAPIIPQLIRSIPTDPDRGLLLPNDDYETLVGRLIRRSGRGSQVVTACLGLLRDTPTTNDPDLKAAISTTHPAWGGHPGPENRAAQILSLTCRDSSAEPRVRAAFERFLKMPEEPVSRTLGNPTWTPVRHWTLFYLARTLGNLGQPASVPALVPVLSDDLNEARHGRPSPSQPEIHLLHLEYTPCWRAAAAWALGEIGDHTAWPDLIRTTLNLDNALDVRHAAASALQKLAQPPDFAELAQIAAQYPDVSVRKALQTAPNRIQTAVKPRTATASIPPQGQLTSTSQSPVDSTHQLLPSPPFHVPEVNLPALRRALEDLVKSSGSAYPKGGQYLSELAQLESAARSQINIRQKFLALQREALLANPLINFSEILIVKRPAQSPSIGLPRNWESNCSLPTDGYDDDLCLLSITNRPIELQSIFKPGKKFIGDVDLHWDANRVLFSMPDGNQRWQVFELTLPANPLPGVPPKIHHLRQLTGEQPDVDSYDACYLPNGQIAFTSTAMFVGVPCVNGSAHVATLYVMDPDGSHIRQLCFDQEHNWCPTVMNDGRLLYTRWEYTDTPHSNTRLLFSMNPDGTSQAAYLGSGSYWPNSFFYARPIPNHSTKIAAVIGGHHDHPRMGELVIFDPQQGRHEGQPAVQRIPGFGKKVEPLIRDGLTLESWPKFLHPWPLSEKYFLVACKPSPGVPWGIYLADVFDNLLPLEQQAGFALLEPIPLRKTSQPPAIQPRVNLNRSDATVVLHDVYSGDGLRGVPRGAVTALRLFTYHYAYQGMGGLLGVVGMDGPWDIKRVLGTVPVEPDGSAHFRIPANTPISIQPLDSEGKALQLMRSWMTAMPGETVQCTGCHDRQNTTPPVKSLLAIQKPPSNIAPWHGPVRGFSFPREVQPVLDQHCVRCHDGQQASNAINLPDLRGTQKIADWNSVTPGNGGYAKTAGKFSVSYAELHRYVRRPGIESDFHLLEPLEFHADTTHLIQLLKKGHHGVQLDQEAWDRLVTWIDLNCPYHGTWGEEIASPGKQRDRRRELLVRYANLHDDPEYVPEIIRQPPKPARLPDTELRPGAPQAAHSSTAPAVPEWPFDPPDALRRQKTSSHSIHRSIEIGPGVKIELIRVPAGDFLMGSSNGPPDEQPLAHVRISDPFWMARFEISNQQFACFNPSHNSRVEDKNAYQFGIHGYPSNEPAQPVVRVSWLEAMAFCRWLSDRTGQSFRLPTEAQWEWACRAGTASPFSFGPANSDFSAHANFADAKLSEFASDPYTIDTPLAKPTPYDDWIPKDARFNDGALIAVPSGRFSPNPWGIYDLHGNVAEWTRSPYIQYPPTRPPPEANDDAALKVVRGGSWRDLPSRGTSSFRLGYQAWQRVYNVGFRIICEEEKNPIANVNSAQFDLKTSSSTH